MSKYRYSARIDKNQPAIVKALRAIPGVTVQVGMDEILIGCKDPAGIPRTYWIEIKQPDTVSKKTGEIKHSAIKESQHKLLANFTGHYAICHSLDQILNEIGIGDGWLAKSI